MLSYFLTRFASVILVLLFTTSLIRPRTLTRQENKKVTADSLIEQHLQSIGSLSARQRITTRIITGTSLVVFRTVPTGQAAGLAVLASDGSKNLIGMSFDSPVYPREEFAFNGNAFIAAFITPGTRSSLGSFLMIQDLIFREGLMGGTLSSAWPLYNLQSHNAKTEYAGTKKINGQTLHEIRYVPRGAGELQISLFLDTTAAKHVRTEYRRLIPAGTGDRSYSNIQERESRFKLIEEFSDFKIEDGLNLPHKYKIEFSADTQSGTFQAEWMLSLNKFVFNEKIDPASFSISTK